MKNDKKTMKNQYRVNEQIHVREVRVVSDNGAEVMPTRKALDLARQQGQDLVEISPNAQPPVCKILDYGKYRFEAQKKAKEAKKNQHVTEVKPLRLSPVIDTHDFDTKLKQARKWSEAGMKVKVDMRFRGRMITRIDVGKQVMNEFIEAMSDIAQIDKAPALEGNTMSVVISPKRNK